MERKIDISENLEKLNPWARKSIELFKEKPYLDLIRDVYPFEITEYPRLNGDLRREIIVAHNTHNTKKLISLLKSQQKFPYEDPIWFLLKNVRDYLVRNPKQVKRISEILYSMTSEEMLYRLEAPPKFNTQTGPMFGAWLKKNFKAIPPKKFNAVTAGIFVLEGSEAESKRFVHDVLKQPIDKRPDLVAKANDQYIIGEAKWIGCPGGNQDKAVVEVLDFVSKQKGKVKRVGIVDGFPWATHKTNGRIINSQEAVKIQESPYDILSTLLLNDYFKQF